MLLGVCIMVVPLIAGVPIIPVEDVEVLCCQRILLGGWSGS